LRTLCSRAALVASLGLALAFFGLQASPAAAAGRGKSPPVINFSRLGKERLTSASAKAIFLKHPKVADWLSRYPRKRLSYESIFQSEGRYWRERVWDKKAGEVAEGRVDDASGVVTQAWTGPQVAWGMARGSPGAFGGKKINSLPIWLGFCGIFLVGLADLRRPLSSRNLDLLMLLSFSVSLWYFNQGRIFSSVPLVYPALFYLAGRLLYIGIRGRPTVSSRPVWPVWLLAAAAVFLIGFRIGLNIRDSNVIDVGYAGVIGADRIASGESPYGHFPVETVGGKTLKGCGPADSEGNVRNHVQANGVCEATNPEGDTYGPVAYLSYLPGLAFFGWSHKWDSLPAAHFTSILFDLLCIGGLVLVGRRFGGARLAAMLPFAWTAYPFTQYVSSSNTNDAIVPAFLIWGFWLVTSPWAKGVAVALSGWTKLGSLIVAPLWATYPDALRLRKLGKPLRFVCAFSVTSVASLSVLAFEPSLSEAFRMFWDKTFKRQIGRQSPFSLWDWRQYHAGLPNLHAVQIALIVLVLVLAVGFAFYPRRRSPLQLAALTGVLLIGLEIVQTYWFYTYIVWFFPFAAIALLAATGTVVAKTRRDVEAERDVEAAARADTIRS
jgi:hypothetical protein